MSTLGEQFNLVNIIHNADIWPCEGKTNSPLIYQYAESFYIFVPVQDNKMMLVRVNNWNAKVSDREK